MALYTFTPRFKGENILIQGEHALAQLIQKIGQELKSLAETRGSLSISMDRVEIEYGSGTCLVVRGRFHMDPQAFEVSVATTVVGRSIGTLELALELSQDLSAIPSVMVAVEKFLITKNGFTKL